MQVYHHVGGQFRLVLEFKLEFESRTSGQEEDKKEDEDQEYRYRSSRIE
jgi:hypothetical protein